MSPNQQKLAYAAARRADIPRTPARSNTRLHKPTVYFVTCDLFSTPLIKIGYTTDLRARMKTLCWQYGPTTRLILAFAGSRADETELHAIFAQFHAFGEWFHSSPKIFEYLENTITEQKRVWRTKLSSNP